MITIIQKLVLFNLPLTSMFQYSDSIRMLEGSPQVYKVIEINKSNKHINGTNKAYIILLEDTSSKICYTILRLKTNCKSSLKIRKEEFYSFSLKKYYEYDSVIELGLKLSTHIDGVVVNIPPLPPASTLGRKLGNENL